LARKQQSDLFGLRLKLPPVTTSLSRRLNQLSTQRRRH